MRTATFPLSRLALMAAAGSFSAGFASLAQANDVYWSVGVASPGVSIGVSSSRPVVVVPAPVYVQPAPVYRRPAPIFVQPQVVYVQPYPVHGWNGWHQEHKGYKGHKQEKHSRDWSGRGERGGERGDRDGYYQSQGYHSPQAGYAPVQVRPQVQYGYSPQVYGGAYGQPGWR